MHLFPPAGAHDPNAKICFPPVLAAVARPTQVGALLSTLVRRVTTPRQRKPSSSTSGAAPALTASTATAPGYYANGGNAGNATAQLNGAMTPRRQSMNLVASIAGRVGSFMGGQQGPPSKPGGAQPQQLGTGTASGAVTPRSGVPLGTAANLPPSGPHGPAAVAAPGLGPMARGLANSSAYANPVPPLPPPHPAAITGAGGAQAAPVSSRGRATYVSGVKH